MSKTTTSKNTDGNEAHSTTNVYPPGEVFLDTAGTFIIGFNSPKETNYESRLTVYNNSFPTGQLKLLECVSAGTGSGFDYCAMVGDQRGQIVPGPFIGQSFGTTTYSPGDGHANVVYNTSDVDMPTIDTTVLTTNQVSPGVYLVSAWGNFKNNDAFGGGWTFSVTADLDMIHQLPIQVTVNTTTFGSFSFGPVPVYCNDFTTITLQGSQDNTQVRNMTNRMWCTSIVRIA